MVFPLGLDLALDTALHRCSLGGLEHFAPCCHLLALNYNCTAARQYVQGWILPAKIVGTLLSEDGVGLYWVLVGPSLCDVTKGPDATKG